MSEVRGQRFNSILQIHSVFYISLNANKSLQLGFWSLKQDHDVIHIINVTDKWCMITYWRRRSGGDVSWFKERNTSSLSQWAMIILLPYAYHLSQWTVSWCWIVYMFLDRYIFYSESVACITMTLWVNYIQIVYRSDLHTSNVATYIYYHPSNNEMFDIWEFVCVSGYDIFPNRVCRLSNMTRYMLAEMCRHDQ